MGFVTDQEDRWSVQFFQLSKDMSGTTRWDKVIGRRDRDRPDLLLNGLGGLSGAEKWTAQNLLDAGV